ncbi:SUMF1/EgtB/PvdO family nonheme iron enzyme [Vibrio astriarenae]|uniref:SUMF1/EgtB/PvdO family nonheme iron enzyme n=1 Tax=Vibrio astriarenae TaxID=1481923 RepID=A0A7Z2T822_9VIBR|nr:SUMF1/EgtB/PvdO family nonheme iron enzyme [Vibrio astriarenae]
MLSYHKILLPGALLMSIALTGCATKPEHPIAASINSQMVLVEGGHYIRGSDAKEATTVERPAREVTVDSFYIAQFEVTQELFHSVMGSSMSFFQEDPMTPVNNLSWQHAVYFVEQLNELTGENYRLPTEAEWEFAAKGGNKSQGYRYAGSDNIEDVAWYAGNSNNRAQPVGQKLPNELGLYDMTGNVGEFVIDSFDDTFYRFGPTNNPANIKDEASHLAHKTVRGGSFAYEPELSENYRRDFASQSILMSDMGLRLAKDAK